jgi:polyisoprenoid-binding protein YceI
MSTQTIQEERIPTGSWTIDPIHSSARFEVGHSGVSTFRGGFGTIDAHLTGGEEPELEGSVEVASIDIAEEQLKGHLLSPEFFDAERHPRVDFRSSELRPGANGEVELRGQLEMGGVTRDVTAQGRLVHLPTDMAGGERIGLSLEAAVNRSDFGFDWQAELPNGGEALAYEVKLAVELELLRQDG